MSLHNERIQLRPLRPSSSAGRVDYNVIRAWEELAYRSVEVISANRAGLDDFADECVYMARIQEGVVALGDGIGQYDESEEDLQTVGLIFLQTSSLPGTFDVGIALIPEAQGRGIGPQALHLALRWAFGELNCHRIQARVIHTDAEWTHFAIAVFLALGFNLEGRARRALFSPVNPREPYPDGSNGEWRDVTYLSVLDVDWVMRPQRPRSPSSTLKLRWQELFSREEKDREELLRWEEWEEKRKRQARDRTPTVLPLQHTVISPHPWTLPPSQTTYPWNSRDVAGDERESAKLHNREMSQMIDAALSDMNRVTLGLTAEDAGGSGWCTPRDPGSPSSVYASGSPFTPFTHGLSPPRNIEDQEARDAARSPALSGFLTPPRSVDQHGDEDDPFSDISSVPRSSSVASGNSDHWDMEGWDFMETSSSGSSIAWSASDDEL